MLTFKEFAVYKPEPAKTLGIPRGKMPQIDAKDYDELFDYLKQNGADIKKTSIRASELKSIQKEFSDVGVVKALNKNLEGTIRRSITSSDKYIIDGHHRVLAIMNSNSNKKVPVIQITNMKVHQLLKLILKFPKTYFKSLY